MPTIAEVRSKYPQYKDISDQELADRLHARFYSDIPKDDFYSRVGLRVAPPEPTLTPRQRAIAAEREASAAELAETESRWQGEPNTLERIANVIAAVTPGKTAREQSLDAARAKAAETQDRLAREEA